jgi:hypothetical protein
VSSREREILALLATAYLLTHFLSFSSSIIGTINRGGTNDVGLNRMFNDMSYRSPLRSNSRVGSAGMLLSMVVVVVVLVLLPMVLSKDVGMKRRGRMTKVQ